MFILFVIVGILAVAALIVGFTVKFRDYSSDINTTPNRVLKWVGGGLGVLSLIFLLTSVIYTQGVGEAKVLLNVDGTVDTTDTDPGFGVLKPLQSTSDWDLFAQEISYVGKGDTNYSGGEVTGPQITTAVAKGAQANVDLSIVYSIQAGSVEALYKKYHTQEAFTKQVVENAIRSATRDVPTAYSAVEFRGDKRGEATIGIQDALQARLDKYGVTIEVVSLQEIRYGKAVESALKAVEVANQKEAEAAANLRATQISAQAGVVEAQAKADANAILNSQPLSPEALQAKYIEALGEGTVYVVPQGSTPLITTAK